MAWTAETDAEVLALDAEGLTRRAIAERLGVSRNAICGKLHRLKPRRATMPDKPTDDEPTEPLPGPTLGKWWEPPPVATPEEPQAIDESALEDLALELVEAVPPLPPPVIDESPKPSVDEIAEMQRLAAKYNLALTMPKQRPEPRTRPSGPSWYDYDPVKRRLLAAEYSWERGERIAVPKNAELAGFFIVCGDGKWERPDPAIGRIDIVNNEAIRADFGAAPNQVYAWLYPEDYSRLQRV